MPQGEILRARRGADRIGLHEAEPLEGAGERGRREQAPRDRVAAQIVPGHLELETRNKKLETTSW